MLGYILKFSILIVAIMVALNIFAPQQAQEVLNYFSVKTNIKEDTLQENLDMVTKFTQDTVEEVSQKVKKNLEK